MITVRDGGSAGFVTVTGQIPMTVHSPSRAHNEQPICADVGYSALPSGGAQIGTFWTLRCRRELSAMIAWLVINIAVAE